MCCSGIGDDDNDSINISTASAFVAASCGIILERNHRCCKQRKASLQNLILSLLAWISPSVGPQHAHLKEQNRFRLLMMKRTG